MLRAWRLSLEALRMSPMRTLLTLNGIVLGILALSLSVSSVSLLDRYVHANLLQHGEGVVRIQRESRYADELRESEVSRRPPLTEAHAQALRRTMPELALVTPELWSFSNQALDIRGKPLLGVNIAGTDASFLRTNNLTLVAGRLFAALEVESRAPVAVLGGVLASRLFGGTPASALGRSFAIRGQSFRVVGVLRTLKELGNEDRRNLMMAIPLSTFERVLGSRSLFLVVERPEGVESEAFHDSLRRAFRDVRHTPAGEPDDFVLVGNEETEELAQNLSIAFGAASGLASLICLVVGGVGLMNVSLVSVLRRRHEIGVRMAVGAHPADIILQFLTEAAVLAILGGLVGVLLATGLVITASRVVGLGVELPFGMWALGLASSTAIGALAGFYPARRAARLAPTEALRSR